MYKYSTEIVNFVWCGAAQNSKLYMINEFELAFKSVFNPKAKYAGYYSFRASSRIGINIVQNFMFWLKS